MASEKVSGRFLEDFFCSKYLLKAEESLLKKELLSHPLSLTPFGFLRFLFSNFFTEKKKKKTIHDSQRRDRIIRIFLRSSAFWGKFLLNYIEKTGETGKNPVETAPRNCRFLSLAVVEYVLAQNLLGAPIGGFKAKFPGCPAIKSLFSLGVKGHLKIKLF